MPPWVYGVRQVSKRKGAQKGVESAGALALYLASSGLEGGRAPRWLVAWVSGGAGLVVAFNLKSTLYIQEGWWLAVAAGVNE